VVADAPPEQFDAAVCASLGMMAQRSGAVAAEFAPAGRGALGAAPPGGSTPVDLAAVRAFARERWEPGLPDGATIVRVTDSRAASETLGALGLRAAVVAPVLHGDVVVATLALAWNDDAPLADPRLPAELEIYAHLLVTDHERNRAVRERARRDAFAEAVLRHSPAVIARWGRDLRIEYVNDAIERVTGTEPSWFEGRTVDDLDWPGEARARWAAATSAVFGTSRPVTIAVELSVPGVGRALSTQVGPPSKGTEIVGWWASHRRRSTSGWSRVQDQVF
jgi:PAS domain-containing protein